MSLLDEAGGTDVGPHEFDPMKPTLIERLRRVPPRCRCCYVAAEGHPPNDNSGAWHRARPLGDRSVDG